MASENNSNNNTTHISPPAGIPLTKGPPTSQLPSWAQPAKKKEGVKSVLAGGLSGAVEIMIMMPTEFIKTQVQLYPQTYGKQSLGWCIRETIKTRGITGFWTGVKPLLLFAIPKNGVRFLVVNKIRDFLKDEQGEIRLGKMLQWCSWWCS